MKPYLKIYYCYPQILAMLQSKNIIEEAVQTISLHFCYNKLFIIFSVNFLFLQSYPPSLPSQYTLEQRLEIILNKYYVFN